MQNPVIERYRLVLFHEYIVDGETHRIEDPITVQYCSDRTRGGIAIVIEEMIERLKTFMIREAVKAEEEKKP